MILPFPRFEEAERVLFIAPHPDDIEVAAGATAAKLAAMGKNVPSDSSSPRRSPSFFR